MPKTVAWQRHRSPPDRSSRAAPSRRAEGPTWESKGSFGTAREPRCFPFPAPGGRAAP